jgi:putative nucleotide binding protein
MIEEKVIVLDYLPNGYPGMKKIEPIAQAIGYHFTLLELSPNKELKVGEIVKLDDKEKIKYIRRKLKEKDLTNFARNNLHESIRRIVKEREEYFVNFFNKSTKISIRMHQLELIPSLGKKHVQIILKERKKPFESFEDIKKRIGTGVEIDELIARRIIKELKGDEKYYLFVPHPKSLLKKF